MDSEFGHFFRKNVRIVEQFVLASLYVAIVNDIDIGQVSDLESKVLFIDESRLCKFVKSLS